MLLQTAHLKVLEDYKGYALQTSD